MNTDDTQAEYHTADEPARHVAECAQDAFSRCEVVAEFFNPTGEQVPAAYRATAALLLAAAERLAPPAPPASPGAVAEAAVSAERLAELRYFLALPSGCWHSPEFAEQAIQELLCAHDNLHAQWVEQWAYANDFREMFEASRKDAATLTARLTSEAQAAREATRELSYERQMRQQTEEAMIKLAARVKEQQQEAADAEAEKLALHEELREMRVAIEKASAAHLSAAEREAYASNTNGQGTRGAFGAGEIMGRVSLAQDLLALFSAPAAAPAAPEAGPAGGFPDGNASGYDAIAGILARHCQTCNGHLNGHGACAYCEPEKVASHD